MQHTLIDGKAHAERLRQSIAACVATLKAEHGLTPGLAVILVGEDAASEVYVRNKKKACLEAGMHSVDHHLSGATTQAELLALITALNHDTSIHGILVQLPLPKHIDEFAVINAITPAKDVDGFHIDNVGRLMIGQPGLVPCTPLGCILLLRDYYASIGHTMAGKHAVVLGRSNIVGKPMAQLLLREHCTVTVCHSKTDYLVGEIRRGDIVIAAIGKPEFVRGHMLKPGAVVIDVGINRIASKIESRVESRESSKDNPSFTSPTRGENLSITSPHRGENLSVTSPTRGEDGRGAYSSQTSQKSPPPNGGEKSLDSALITRLVGDVNFGEATAHTIEMPGASAITPVPGGVGPMTIACLLRNTVEAACNIAGITFALHN